MNPFHLNDYRPEVDGLRALAVISVILFHAGFAFFSGGFVGVDVFFVISGFLITGLIVKDEERGTFSLRVFYARRARRILPALAVVLVACWVLVFLLLEPSRRLEYSQLMTAVSLFYSNILLASSTGYFNGVADEKLLLHTWSLAVEEQYYFVFPLAVHLLWRFRWGKLLFPLLLTVALASMAWSEYGWRHHQDQTFFLTGGRVWELMLGSIAAWVAIRKGESLRVVSVPMRQVLCIAGLLAIVGAVLFFDSHTPTPSVYGLLPTLGTALVLLFGSDHQLSTRLLRIKPVVWIGLVSYSAYLWHQPLFALARLLNVGAPSVETRLGLIAITFFLAHLTWKYVERPVRLLKTAGPSRTLYAALACTIALTCLGLGGQQLSKDKRGVVPASVMRSFQAPVRSKECFDIDYAHNTSGKWSCEVNANPNLTADFMLFGDSHALQLLEAFEVAAQHASRRGEFAGFSGCIPLLGVYQLTRGDQLLHDCNALNARVFEHVKAQGIKDVFLVAKWSYYIDYWNGTHYINAIGQEKGATVSIENSRAAFEWGLANTLKSYSQAGIRLHLIEQVPQQTFQPEIVYERAWQNRDTVDKSLQEMSVSRERHRQLQAYVNSVFDRSGPVKGLTVSNFDDIYCSGDTCSIGTADTTYYRDFSHLSEVGASMMIPMLEKMLRAKDI